MMKIVHVAIAACVVIYDNHAVVWGQLTAVEQLKSVTTYARVRDEQYQKAIRGKYL